MRDAVHKRTIELLLASMYCDAGEDGLFSSFFYGRPGSASWDRRLGTTIYYSRKKLVRAVLYVRQHGPPYLRYLAVGDIWSILTTFVSDNYWYLSEEAFFKRFPCSFAEYMSDSAKTKMAEALAASSIFNPVDNPTLFPLVIVRVEADFATHAFFLCAPTSLPTHLGQEDCVRWMKPEQFPPTRDWKGRIEFPSCWLGVRSPTRQSSTKMKSAILGALALTPGSRYRYTFTGRKMFGGTSTIADGVSTTFGDAHTPPLGEDIVIGAGDQAWLTILGQKFQSNEKKVRRELRALEYFYRAWPTDQSERFPILCMALDAVFGDANQATRAVIEGVRTTLGEHVSEPRLRLLMELRAAVIHGGAPDVYDSRKYGRYYEAFGHDPIVDLELVVAACLRKRVFGGALVEHADPNAQMIAEMQAKGRLPKQFTTETILGFGTD